MATASDLSLPDIASLRISDSNNNETKEFGEKCENFLNERNGNRLAAPVSDHADVRFILVGTESFEQFVANKMTLSLYSPVFQEMFFGTLGRRSGSEVTITDVHPLAFSKMLQFIYTGNVGFETLQSALDTICVAKKYSIPALETLAVCDTISHIKAENVATLLRFGHLYDVPDIVYYCCSLISSLD